MLLLHVCNETAQLQFYFQGLHFLHTKIKFKNCIPIELLKIFSCISRGGGGGGGGDQSIENFSLVLYSC